MSWQPNRDFVGYGPTTPDPKWPNGARVAVNFVMNYEEGSEPSVQDGEGYTETGHRKPSKAAPAPGPVTEEMLALCRDTIERRARNRR